MLRRIAVKFSALMILGALLPSIALAEPLALYWTDRALGAVRRVDLATSSIVTLVNGLPGPQGIAVDPVDGYVYWADTTSRAISRCRLDGSGLEEVLSVSGFPKGLDIDPEGRDLYWADPVLRTLSRLDLDTGAVELVASGIGIPQDVGYDARSGRVLWIESAAGIFSLPTDDLPAPESEALLVTTDFVGQATVFAIAEDRARVYWGAAQKLRSSGLFGDCFERFRPVIGTVKGIDYDPASQRLFWIEEETGSIFSADPDGEALSLVLTNEPQPWRLAVGPAVAAPRIVEQPRSNLVPLGAVHELAVRAAGGGELEFQWRKDGQPLPEAPPYRGTRTARLTISGVSPLEVGRYDCLVVSDGRSSVSDAAVVGLDASAAGDPSEVDAWPLPWRELLRRR